MSNDRDSIRIDISGADTGRDFLARSGISPSPLVAEFSRFLYHLNLVYEIARLATDARYQSFRFPRHTFRPILSRLAPIDRLILFRVQQNSPWELSLLLHDPITQLTAGLGALWLFVQCLERISIIRLNRRKLKAEIDKLALESAKLRRELASAESVERPRISAASPSKQTEAAPVSTLTRLEHNMESDTAESASLLPPGESQRLYNALKRRGAKRFYESNGEAIARLGFQVEDFDIQIRQGR